MVTGEAILQKYKLLVLLAPVALLAGLALRWTRQAPPSLAVTSDRAQFIELARKAATMRGINATGWRSSITVPRDDNVVRASAYASQIDELRARLSPPGTIRVRLHPPSDDAQFEARLSPSGDLDGWSESGIAAAQAPSAGAQDRQEQAKSIAQNWLNRYGPVTFAGWRSRSGDDNTDDRFEGHARFAAAPKQTYRVEIGFRQGRAVSGSIESEQNLSRDTVIGDLEQLVQVFAFTLTGFFLFYSIRLYRRRKREGEIPRDRALMLVVVFGICGGVFVGLSTGSVSGGTAIQTAVALGRAILAGLGTSLAYAFGGLFVAAAYASGEGEIREGWPGKLVSFDALLAGRWFTRGVGISAVVAGVAAAWIFLIAALAWRLEPPQASILVDKELITLALGPGLLIRTLTDLPLSVSFLIVAGLFMPLAFVHRRHWRGWKLWTALIVCPLLVSAGFRVFALSGIGPLATTLGAVAALLVPFYVMDVLAAVLGALLYTALSMTSDIAAAVPAVSGTLALVLLVVTAGLVPLVTAAWRGAEVDERTVRPKYARNIAERLSLKAEVSAAREAQLRLLPVEFPQRKDLSIAAYCQPAGVVGGDFYDFFSAPDGRLTVFVASGSGLGMASALTIALAKGFLASEIRRGESPGNALQALLPALSGRVGAAADRTGLLLMAVDPATGRVELARRGKFPVVWIMRGKECLSVSMNGPGPLETGTFDWRGGDAIVVNTEGFAALLSDQSLSGQSDWLRVTARRTAGEPAPRIEQDLTRRLGGRKGNRLRRLLHDVTAVILRNEAA